MQYKGSPVVEASPRSNITIPFFVTNTSRIDQELTSSVEMPEAWNSATAGSSITVSARASDLVLVHVFVPMGAAAGEYRLSFVMTDSTGQTDSIPFTVRVLAEKGVQTELLSRPDYILQGESYDAVFSVLNSGNIEMRYALTVFSGNRLPYSLSIDGTDGNASEISVAAGQSVPVTVRVDTSALTGSGFLHTLELKAIDLDPEFGSNPLTSRSRSTVEIVRVSGVDPSIMHRLPFTFGFSASSEASAPGEAVAASDPDGSTPAFFNADSLAFRNEADLTLKSSGSLDEYGKQKIKLDIKKHAQGEDFLIQDPADRYLFEYNNPFAALQFGDRNWSHSPLLGASDFGRGAGAAAKLPFVQVGGYYYTDQFSEVGGSAAGGYAIYERKVRDYRNGYLYRASAGVKSDLADTLHFSLAQNFQSPPKNIDVSLDLAGMLDPEKNLGKAAVFDGEASYDLWHFALKGVYADPGFKGLYSDLYQINASVMYTLVDFMVDLRTFVSLSENNLAMDEKRGAAARNLVAQLTGEHVFSAFETKFTTGYANRTSGDRRNDMLYDVMTHTVLFRVSQPLGTLKAGLLADFDLIEHAADEQYSFGHTARGSLLWTYRPLSTVNASLFFNGTHSGESGSAWRFGGDAGTVRSFPADTFSFSLGNSWYLNEQSSWSTSVSASGRFTHKFVNQQDFSASLSVLNTINPVKIDHDFKVELRYTMPFSLPVSRKQSVALIRGRVVNGITGSPIAGLILRCDGLATTTNKQGIYSFYIAKDGDFYLTVDQTRLPAGTMTDIVTPYKVSLKRGKVKTLNFAVIPESTIEGFVLLYTREKGPGPEGTLKKGAGLANVLLELGNGNEVKRLYTDRSGRFKFSHVQPGKWTLTVLDARLPEYHIMEIRDTDFDVQPGENKRAEFRAVPEIRNIVIVEDELVLTVEPAAPARARSAADSAVPADAADDAPADAADDAPADASAGAAESGGTPTEVPAGSDSSSPGTGTAGGAASPGSAIPAPSSGASAPPRAP